MRNVRLANINFGIASNGQRGVDKAKLRRGVVVERHRLHSRRPCTYLRPFMQSSNTARAKELTSFIFGIYWPALEEAWEIGLFAGPAD